jgi:membrane fusion protein
MSELLTSGDKPDSGAQSVRVAPDYSQLFRRQAIDAASSRYGSPVRPIGLGSWVLTLFACALLIVVAIGLTIGTYTRKETVSGVLQPAAGATRIMSLRPGAITEVYVVDGQEVAAGDPIARLSTDPSVAHEGDAPAALSVLVEEGAEREKTAMAAQAAARLESSDQAMAQLRSRASALRADAAHLRGTRHLQSERLRLSEETLEAGRLLRERELFSLLQLRQREEAVLAARQQLASIDRELMQIGASLEEIVSETGALQAQRAQLNAEIALHEAQFEQRHTEHLADHGIILTATKPGRVAALTARAGATVEAGRTIAVILPAGTGLEAELWVPSKAAGFLHVGAPVRLMYDAFPYQKFGVGRGVISSIAGAPTDPSEITMPLQTQEALYRVLVKVPAEGMAAYGGQERLAPGMRLSADLILDERSLWEWLLDPIIAMRSRAGS